LINVVNTSVIGHIGTSGQVAGVGMAIMTLQLVAFGVTLGINNALSTLVSQAFGSK